MEARLYCLQKILCIILFGLIILGAGVRLANAGLACPDWPLCLGKAVPDFNFQVFMEWIHRMIAGSSGIIALVVSIGIWKNSELRSKLGLWSIAVLLLFGLQAFLGRQTVLQFLKSETVASHLVGGYTLFAANVVILFKWKPKTIDVNPFLKIWFAILLALSFFQATLGGTVSSHYAGLACGGEFPKCQGQWWPEFIGGIGFHYFHRLGAYALLTFSILLFIFALKKTQERPVRQIALIGFLLVLLQVVWGISMVFNAVHPALSLAHSATALGIFTTYLIGVCRGCIR